MSAPDSGLWGISSAYFSSLGMILSLETLSIIGANYNIYVPCISGGKWIYPRSSVLLEIGEPKNDCFQYYTHDMSWSFMIIRDLDDVDWGISTWLWKTMAFRWYERSCNGWVPQDQLPARIWCLQETAHLCGFDGTGPGVGCTTGHPVEHPNPKTWEFWGMVHAKTHSHGAWCSWLWFFSGNSGKAGIYLW